jgi:phosphoribosylamine-glycine ligase
VAPTLLTASNRSRRYAEHIRFAGRQMRHDIAWRELRREAQKSGNGSHA